jgi:alpha-L-fucosidase
VNVAFLTFSIPGGANGEPWQGYTRISKNSELKHPANTYIFVEEADTRGTNVGSWQMNPCGFRGDTETPEGMIPAIGYPGGRDWETCMTINDTWGYKSWDTNYKSTETLIRNLCDTASKGGNYLLNVGTAAEGLIPQPQIDRLLEMGKWLKVNGDAIYATRHWDVYGEGPGLI